MDDRKILQMKIEIAEIRLKDLINLYGNNSKVVRRIRGKLEYLISKVHQDKAM